MKRASLTVLIIILLISCQTKGEDGFHKLKSSHSINETVGKLSHALKAKGMTIFTVINHQEGALMVDMELRPTTLVIFGNPKVGTKLILCDQRVGYALPLKMLIWQDDAGTTWLGYWDPSQLKNEYDIESCSETIVKIENAMLNFAIAATS